MSADVAALAADLLDEQAALLALIESVGQRGWRLPTPAEGWDVADSVSHLCYYDEAAASALTDPAAFEASKPPPARTEPTIGVRVIPETPDVAIGRSLVRDGLLERWAAARAGLLDAVRSTPADARVPWFGPPMGLATFVSARIMETWAHGQDIADAVGAAPVISERLRHICHLGVATRAYSFSANGARDPGDPIRVEVEAPGGGTWSWGPAGVRQKVHGSALDLALVVTQRRHFSDTDLWPEGAVAAWWLSIAQCYAGPPGSGRQPGLGRARSRSEGFGPGSFGPGDVGPRDFGR